MTHKKQPYSIWLMTVLLATMMLFTACSPWQMEETAVSPPTTNTQQEPFTDAPVVEDTVVTTQHNQPDTENVVTEVPVTPINNLDDTDTQLFQRTAQLYALFRSNSSDIWADSYRLDQMALMYVRTDGQNAAYAYLINHPKAAELAGAQKVELPADLNLPPVYRFDTIPSADQVAQVPNYEFNLNLAGTETYLMKYTTPDVDEFASPVSHDWTLYVAHEGLHDRQMDHWQESPSNFQDVAGYPLTADHLALIMLEDAVLQAALEANDAATRDQAVRQFIAIRQTRINQWDEVRLLDLPQEQMEGTARYIEHRVGSLVGYDGINLNNFNEMLEPVPSSGIRDAVAFGRFYGTGAAQSHLLDELGIDWKTQIEQGKSQFDLLAAHFNLSDADINALLAEAKAAHNFEAMVPQAEQAAQTAVSEPTDIFAEDMSAEGDYTDGDYVEGDFEDGDFVDGDFEDGDMAEFEGGPFPEKPFETAPSDLVFNTPAGYELQGGYTVNSDEIMSDMRIFYTPQGSDVQVVSWFGEGFLQVTSAQHSFGSLDELVNAVPDFGMATRETVAGQEILLEDFSDSYGPFTVATLLRGNEFIVIEGTITADEMMTLAADILGG